WRDTGRSRVPTLVLSDPKSQRQPAPGLATGRALRLPPHDGGSFGLCPAPSWSILPCTKRRQAWCRAPYRDKISRAAREQEQAMRFGTFVFSLRSEPTQDHQVIVQTLREVELAEA